MVTSTRMTGSFITGPPAPRASLKAIEPAILNAISLESTGWNDPSSTDALHVHHGEAGDDAVSMASLIPCSMAGMYSRGITPPTILFTKSNPPPGSSGSTWIQQSPNIPRPPVCRTYRPSAFAEREIVSL